MPFNVIMDRNTCNQIQADETQKLSRQPFIGESLHYAFLISAFLTPNSNSSLLEPFSFSSLNEKIYILYDLSGVVSLSVLVGWNICMSCEFKHATPNIYSKNKQIKHLFPLGWTWRWRGCDISFCLCKLHLPCTSLLLCLPSEFH